MKIIRGTFRLSILIALLVAAFYGIMGYMAGVVAEQANRKAWTTLRCGERFLDQDMSRFKNKDGLIDIGSAGCSDQPFLATFEEIREAVASPAPPSLPGLGGVYRDFMYAALFTAVAAFVLVNSVGFVLLGARGVFRWVRAGYR
jgi:NADH:ubiquinone oxidoreductase subunit 3 (subunit A)